MKRNHFKKGLVEAVLVALAVFFIAALASGVHAATATLSAPGTSCQYDRIDTDSAGNLSVSCAKSAPPVPPDPQPGGCPSVPGLVVWPTLGPSGQGSVIYVSPGEVYAWPLPSAAAILSSTAHPGTPQELKIGWSIGPCPGDTSYAKSPAASYTGRGGVVYHPCIVEGGIESGGFSWGPTAAQTVCKLPAGVKWYVTLRLLGGTAQCPIVGGSQKCPIVYSWW